MNPGRELFLKEYTRLNRELGLTTYAKDVKWKRLWKTIHLVLKVLSFGKLNTFYTGYTITIGNKVFFPAGWSIKEAEATDYVTLRHEAKHIRDNIRLGIGNATLGTLIMGFLYLFIPFPIGFAWFRYKFEREAYAESYYACKRAGFVPDIKQYVELLSGPQYLWTWCRKKDVLRWFEQSCR
jgi:hypothetical protein